MKAAIVFDSVFGNTKQVAEAIAEQLRSDGLEVELRNLREEKVKGIQADVLFVGGPTRMKHMTRKIRGFVRKLDREYWSKHQIMIFDTYGPISASTEEERSRQEPWINPGSAGETQALATERGLMVHPTTLRSAVTGLKGPLDSEALAEAKKYAHERVAHLRR